MKKSPKFLIQITVLFALCFLALGFQSYTEKQNHSEKVELFKKKLSDLSEVADNKFFVIHLESILQVINAEKSISGVETEILEKMYDAFLNDSLANPSDFDSYLKRKRTLILAWVSPTDGATSFSWLRLPKDWDEKKEYPLYVQLHGLWDVAANPISFMSFTFNENPSPLKMVIFYRHGEEEINGIMGFQKPIYGKVLPNLRKLPRLTPKENI